MVEDGRDTETRGRVASLGRGRRLLLQRKRGDGVAGGGGRRDVISGRAQPARSAGRHGLLRPDAAGCRGSENKETSIVQKCLRLVISM